MADSLKFYPVLVDNVSGSVGPQELRSMFSQIGHVVDVVIVSSHAFVNMNSPSDARDAIIALNGSPLHHRRLHVDYSEELKDFFSYQRIPFSPTVNPEAGRTRSCHPPYPSETNSQIESPYYQTNYLNDDELDERLRRVNQELSALNDDDYHDRRRRRSRSRSRDGRSRSPHHHHRDRHQQHHESEYQRSSQEERDHRHAQSRNYEEVLVTGPRDEYQIFIGGLHNPVSFDNVQSLYKQFGKVIRTNVFKNFALLTLLTDETNAMNAISQTNGIIFCSNIINVSFKKGSKHDNLNDVIKQKAMLQMQGVELSSSGTNVPVDVTNSDAVTSEVMNQAQSIMKASIPELPVPVPSGFGLPVPVASSASSSLSVATAASGSQESSDLMGKFASSIRQTTGLLTNWSVDRSTDDAAFDGYGGVDDAPSQDNSQEQEDEIVEIDPEPSSSSVSPSVKTPSADDLRMIMQTVQNVTKTVESTDTTNNEQEEEVPPPAQAQAPRVNEGPSAQRVVHVSGISSRVDDHDLKSMLSEYGQISRVHNKVSYAFVNIYCTELMMVKLICEQDGRIVKGGRMRVSFKKGSYEDSQEFKDKYAEQIKQFTSPEYKKQLELSFMNRPQKMRLSQIGESLRNMDMSLSLAPVPPNFFQPQQHHPDPQYQQQQPVFDQEWLYDIKGVIQSIQNKIVIAEFLHPFTQSRSLAKMIPGQMYINAVSSLGLAIKSNTSHSWPAMVRQFLQIDQEIMMNLRRLSDKEMHEQKDKVKSIQWLIPQAWIDQQKPSEEETMLSLENMDSRIATAVITKLFPSWGVLKNQDGEIMFRAGHVYWESGKLEVVCN